MSSSLPPSLLVCRKRKGLEATLRLPRDVRRDDWVFALHRPRMDDPRPMLAWLHGRKVQDMEAVNHQRTDTNH